MSAAFVALVDEKNQMLCLHHTYGERAWGLPGGYVDKNETSFDGAKREFEEETGAKFPFAQIFNMIEIYPNSQSVVYVARIKSLVLPAKSPSREIDEMKWLTKNELQSLPLRSIFKSYYTLIFSII